VRRPRIGITIGYDGSRDGVFQLRQDYVRSVEQAQALPLVLARDGRRTRARSWTRSTG